jgi:hypothetical protein
MCLYDIDIGDSTDLNNYHLINDKIKSKIFSNDNIIKINKIINSITLTMNQYENKFDSIKNTNEYKDFRNLVVTNDTGSYNTYLQTIYKFIKVIDNHNAASVIGTLEFLDNISRFNTTNIVCSPNKIIDPTIKIDEYTMITNNFTNLYKNKEKYKFNL